MRLRQRDIVVSGLRIHYWESRPPAALRTTPVVLVHGLGVSSRYLLPTAEHLAPRFTVLAPDLPHVGRSDRPCHQLHVPQLADMLAAWMDAVGLHRATLVANSMGTQVAAECAARHPWQVARLVLLGPTIDCAARSMPRQALRLALAALREPLSVWRLVLCDFLRCGPVRLVQSCRYALAHRVEDTLQRVAAPVLIVRGEDDPLVPARWAEELVERCRDGRLRVMPEAAHIPNYSAPERFVAVIEPFLTEANVDENWKERSRGREETRGEALSAVRGDEP